MLLEINHHSGVPIYRQVIEQIQQQIMVGQSAMYIVEVYDSSGNKIASFGRFSYLNDIAIFDAFIYIADFAVNPWRPQIQIYTNPF